MTTRSFNGTTDELSVDEGGLDSALNGAWTILVLFKTGSVGSFMAIMSVEAAGPSMRAGIWTSSASELLLVYGGVNYTFSGLGLSANTWYLAAVKRTAGTGKVPRANLYNFTGATWDTWTNADGGAAADNDASTIIAVRFGDWPNGNPFGGLIGAADIHPSALADATIETLTAALSDWTAQSPTALWAFDQDDVGDPVLDLTGGGADQTAITGTTVSADVPAGFDFGNEPPEPPVTPIFASLDGGTTATLSADGTTTATALGSTTTARTVE